MDTSALLAFCKTNYDKQVFENLKMTTTNICEEEIRRGSGGEYETQEQPRNRYMELLRENNNPDSEIAGEYKPYVDDQGENSLEWLFEQNTDIVKHILLFDFDAIQSFDNLKHDLGGDALNTQISLPNFAFELLRREGVLTDDEYCKATYQMAIKEGWLIQHAKKFAKVSPVECDRFP